jgi:hypothetical protein
MAKKFLWVLLTTTFFNQLGLGQVKSLEQEVFEYKENIRNLQSRIKALQERYNEIGKRLGDNLVSPPKQTETQEFPSQQSLSNPPQEDQSSEVVSAVPTPEVSTPSPPPREFEVQSVHKKNTLALKYAICVPHETDFGNFKIDYKTGHLVGIDYKRNSDIFSWGFDLSAKYYQTEAILNVPGFGSIDAGGDNFSISSSLLAGFHYQFNDILFTEGHLGVGVNYSMDEIIIGSNKLQLKDTNFYGSLGLGFGAQLNEYLQLLLFYKLDGHSYPSIWKSNHQLFSQFGLSLGMNY